MRFLRCLSICTLLIAFFCFTVAAQNDLHKADKADALTITATASNERLRFTAPTSVVQMRLEVYNAGGRKLFDNELRGGNALDWHLLDGQAQALVDDAYLCVITVKSLSGRITQKIGSVKIQQGIAIMQSTSTSQLTPQQVEAIGPVEESAALTILEAEPKQTTTLLAHDGKDGQLTRGQGALSFRLGDFYSGKDQEQMRLTAEGNLGIGISQPQTRLDVDGFVRATQGIVFPDGPVQFSASRKTYGATSLKPGQFQQKGEPGQEHLSPDIGGTGTTGRIAKWQDGPNGILNDANLTEVSGAIGVNATPDMRFRLDVNGSTRIRGSNPGFNLEGLRAAGNIWLFQTVDSDGRFRLFSQDNANPGVERLTISLSTGNVGIGATTPMAKLDVGGAINTATQYTIGGLRALAANGPFDFGGISGLASNTFAGELAGVNTMPSANLASALGKFNSFFGSGAGTDNTTGASNSFYGTFAGTTNTTGGSNAFFGVFAGFSNNGNANAFFGAGAGQSNTTGSNNAFFGTNSGNANFNGNNNSFFGTSTGAVNTGGNNTFIGYSAGAHNTAGLDNVFIGKDAGLTNTTGPSNTFIGRSAGAANTDGSSNNFIGVQAGFSNVIGLNNNFFGTSAGQSNTNGRDNTFVGDTAGFSNITGSNNSVLGSLANVASGDLTNATAIGSLAQVGQSNSLVLGSIDGVNGATASTSVGIGTTAPKARFEVQNGNILIGSPGQGLILKSPDGNTCRMLMIDNGGNLIISVISCP